MIRNAIRSMFRRPPQEEATASQELVALLLCVGAVAFFVWWYQHVSSVRWEFLQQVLQLPQGIERSRFTPFRMDKSFEELRRGTAEATFPEEQLQEFVRMVDDGGTRQTGPASVNRVPVESYSSRSLAWTRPPLADRVGDRLLQAEGLVPASGSAANLRVFCMVLQDRRAWDDPSPKLAYLAKGCSELKSSETPDYVIVAVIDVTARTLRIRVE